MEILSEIFKAYAASPPELLDRRVVDLCLVGKYLNMVTNHTPQLWTKINLSFPFKSQHLAAAFKRVHASQLEEIDVSIDFRDKDWNGDGPLYDDTDVGAIEEFIWVKSITAVLKGTEQRWKSSSTAIDLDGAGQHHVWDAGCPLRP